MSTIDQGCWAFGIKS